MSLLPYFFDDFYKYRPSRLLDKHFGMPLDPEDLLEPWTLPREIRKMFYDPFGYIKPWRTLEKDFGSSVTWDKDKFQVNLDVQHFAPNEVHVKVTGDNEICVEGKHEERRDNHGYISRQFVRKYYLPKGHDGQRVESKLSSDGVLTITAPRVDAVGSYEDYRKIPIEVTGKPSKAIEYK